MLKETLLKELERLQLKKIKKTADQKGLFKLLKQIKSKPKVRNNKFKMIADLLYFKQFFFFLQISN